MRVVLFGGPDDGRRIVIAHVPADRIVHCLDGGYAYLLTEDTNEEGYRVAVMVYD